MIMRVCIAVSNDTEVLFNAKLLPTTRDQIVIVGRLDIAQAIAPQLHAVFDHCDVILYDPAIDDGKGLAVWKNAENAPQLCCWCTRPQDALAAMKAGAMFVLFDSSSAVDVDVAIRRCRRVLRGSAPEMMMRSPGSTYTPDVIALPHMHGIEVRSCDSIVHVEGQGNYTNVVFVKEPKLLMSRTIGDYEEALAAVGFVRVHRSHIVNMRHVRRIIPGKTPRLVLTNGDNVAVSQRYRPSLMRNLNLITRKEHSAVVLDEET